MEKQKNENNHFSDLSNRWIATLKEPKVEGTEQNFIAKNRICACANTDVPPCLYRFPPSNTWNFQMCRHSTFRRVVSFGTSCIASKNVRFARCVLTYHCTVNMNFSWDSSNYYALAFSYSSEALLIKRPQLLRKYQREVMVGINMEEHPGGAPSVYLFITSNKSKEF